MTFYRLGASLAESVVQILKSSNLVSNKILEGKYILIFLRGGGKTQFGEI
jgi:hypothetical protein